MVFKSTKIPSAPLEKPRPRGKDFLGHYHLSISSGGAQQPRRTGTEAHSFSNQNGLMRDFYPENRLISRLRRSVVEIEQRLFSPSRRPYFEPERPANSTERRPLPSPEQLMPFDVDWPGVIRNSPDPTPCNLPTAPPPLAPSSLEQIMVARGYRTYARRSHVNARRLHPYRYGSSALMAPPRGSVLMPSAPTILSERSNRRLSVQPAVSPAAGHRRCSWSRSSSKSRDRGRRDDYACSLLQPGMTLDLEVLQLELLQLQQGPLGEKAKAAVAAAARGCVFFSEEHQEIEIKDDRIKAIYMNALIESFEGVRRQ